MTDYVEDILSTEWSERKGNVIPSTENVTLADGAVEVTGTFLYADLAGSFQLAKLCPWQTTAKIIRAYLDCATRLIIANDGEIRSFDGDRVMGVFMGETPNINATTCARQIDWVIEKVIDPKATAKFKSVQENNIKIRHAVGIDTGTAQAVRAGIRNNNDLIWIGRPPSLAAKLSDVRNYPYAVHISKECYTKLPDSSKIVDGVNIWEAKTYVYAGEETTVYRTKTMRSP